VDVRLQTFPSRDGEFQDSVGETWAALPPPQTPDTLQRSLRGRYPAAIVTVQAELARHGDGPSVWYVFRTAAIGTPTSEGAAGPAYAILDDDRRFVEVSAELAAITELAPRRMVGHAVEDFSNPADPTIREDIERLWQEFRTSGTLASTVRFNFADGRPRELGYQLEADADGPGRHRLTVRVLPAPED